MVDMDLGPYTLSSSCSWSSWSLPQAPSLEDPPTAPEDEESSEDEEEEGGILMK